MIVAITGPTGVGKTKLSVELAKRLNAEIINADSMQVYKELNIATAKIKEEEKEGIPHHLFDIKEPYEEYSVFDYQNDAREKIEEITSRGKNVIFVGGTGLYLKATLYDYRFEKEENKYNFVDLSDEELYQEVLKLSPDCKIHPNNRRRLERYLTKIRNGNMEEIEAKPLYDFKIIGLTTDRKNLYERINKRVEIMLDEGLLEEAKIMYDKYRYTKAINTGIGYKELFPYFDGDISLDEALDKIKKNSRHYAKRQYTFFSNQFPIKWVETNYDNFELTIEDVLNYLKS